MRIQSIQSKEGNYLCSNKRGQGSEGRQRPEMQPRRCHYRVCFMLTMPQSSQSPEQLSKMMVVIVTVCAAFGLTVSEAKTEIMCLRTRGTPDAAASFSVEAAGQVYKQTHDFVYLGGNVNHDAGLPIHQSRPAHTQRLVQLPSERSPRAQDPRMLEAEVLETILYGCVTWNPCSSHYDALRAHHKLLIRCIG